MRVAILSLLCAVHVAAAIPSIADKTKGLTKIDGYHALYWDEEQGKLWLEISRWNTEFLYVSSLPAGIGSNDIGLDRGQLGDTRIVRWERVGPRVLLTQSNYDFRAITDSSDERRAVKDSFAESVIAGFEVAAITDGTVLVDATAFYLRDAHDVAGQLQRARQGSWRADDKRSAFFLERTKNFPRNTEVEATITFTGGPAAQLLASVSPASDAVTVRQHHSFIELPEPGYQLRELDPRGGFFGISYYDFSTPVSEPIVKRYIRRHRLQKKDPSAKLSEPVKPIVYYLDRGTPEPIRTALLEGARWWTQAFEAAGFKDAFNVEVMPEGADPMDVRYNVIQWVHRSTRGWSYGSSVSDPRTGEIIKGHVTLGSLRVRQDFLIAEAFRAPYANGAAADPQMLKMSLDRLRQLSAHEVGHTLGLGHNYIASTANLASVMDYPHPIIKLGADGKPDVSAAYDLKIGEWDKVAITWGYGEFGTGASEKQALNRVLDDAARRGLVYLSDQDARPPGSAHPTTHLWDNGANAADELNRLMQVRAVAIQRFGENNIRVGTPMALLQDVFVPLYLSHRYQTEAAAKVIGGLDYRYALRGDGQTVTAMVSPAEQRKAFDALLATITPQALMVPERIVALIPPRPAGFAGTRELFSGRTNRTFDAFAPVETAADMTIALLLNAERANRLVQHHAIDSNQPSLEDVLAKLLDATWRQPAATGYAGEVQRTVQTVVLRRLMALAIDQQATGPSRGAALNAIVQIKRMASGLPSPPHHTYIHSLLEAFEKDPKSMSLPAAPTAPPGMPIGMEESCDWR